MRSWSVRLNRLSAVCALRNQASGFSAARALSLAIMAASCRRFSSGVKPRCARRAESRMAKVVYAWRISWLISLGWLRVFKRVLRFALRFRPAELPARLSCARLRVASASAPVTSTARRSPCSIFSAASQIKRCGLVPLMPESCRSPGWQTQRGGERAGQVIVMPAQTAHDIQFIDTVNDGGDCRNPPRRAWRLLYSAPADAAHHRPPGRHVFWATPTMQGSWLFMRSLSRYFPVQRGGRFSANALGPSFASSLLNTRPLSSDSIL